MAIIRPYSVFDYIGFFVNFEHKHQSHSNKVLLWGFFFLQNLYFLAWGGWQLKFDVFLVFYVHST